MKSHSYRHGPIVADLRARIADGTYQPGERLPSQADLRAHYGIGDRTARAVLRELTNDGVAVTHPRRGIFVATPEQPEATAPTETTIPPRLRRTHAARRHAPSDAPTPGDEDLHASTTTTTDSPPPDVALLLDTEPTPAMTVHRMVLNDEYNRPVGLRTTYVPGTTAETEAATTVITYTSARRPTTEEAHLLATTRAAIVLVHDETTATTTANAGPIAHTRSVYRADTVRLADQYRPRQ